MAKFEFGFDSFGEDYGIKTFLNKHLSTRLDWDVKFKDYVVIWFECAKVSNYNLPNYNTTPSCVFHFFLLEDIHVYILTSNVFKKNKQLYQNSSNKICFKIFT